MSQISLALKNEEKESAFKFLTIIFKVVSLFFSHTLRVGDEFPQRMQLSWQSLQLTQCISNATMDHLFIREYGARFYSKDVVQSVLH